MVEKARDAFLTIGELSSELGVPQHVLRYWETRFPALRPLTRAGNRRYYRPEDVTLARRIARALNHDGYTIKGVQKLLDAGGSVQPHPDVKDGAHVAGGGATDVPAGIGMAGRSDIQGAAEIPQVPIASSVPPQWLEALITARDNLAHALSA